MHTFVYVRVSTTGQTVENQIQEIEAAGYKADAVYRDIISGKVPAAERPEFSRMLDSISRTNPPKRLVVSKLDRLGRDAVDVLAIVRNLEMMGCSVRVLQLGDLDLTSSAGKLVLSTLAAVAEMERDLLVERTQSGLARAKAEGKTLGRPKLIDQKSTRDIQHHLDAGVSISELSRQHGVSRATIMRIRDAG